MTDQEEYITLRIINACIREDVASLIHRGEIRHERGQCWLYNMHLDIPLRIQVEPCNYMQPWRAVASHWQELHGDTWQTGTGYATWLRRLMPDQSEETRQRFASYQEEADAACKQGDLCHQAFMLLSDDLSRPLHLRSWGERMRHAEQMASFLDHPFYPTARPKFGFDLSQIKNYAPEFCSVFRLRWLAVPATMLTLTRPEQRPQWWPVFSQVGLPETLQSSHHLIPVHPLTWSQLHALPSDIIHAPNAWLEVYPTLSVRTVQLADWPEDHIKVPLAMRTLGQKNIRLIKASTLYDGQWFADILPQLAECDPLLNQRYRHVNEAYFGHVGEERQLAFLVRRYPQAVAEETLAPVAALESNQQNAIISFTPGQPPSLVMKDNDAARLLISRFGSARPDLLPGVWEIKDKRILAEDDVALAQMFITITLQLDIAALLENLAERGLLNRAEAYEIVRYSLCCTLDNLDKRGTDTSFARQMLFEAPLQPVKYLLLSGSLMNKSTTGVADINKYYGLSGPNFLCEDAVMCSCTASASTSHFPEAAATLPCNR